MIKIQNMVRDIVIEEPEATYALTNGFMNMSGYAKRIKKEVEKRTKKNVTRTSLVVALSRVKNELKRATSSLPKVKVENITTKLPISELVYEKTELTIRKLDLLHKKVNIPVEDFFTATMGTGEITILTSTKNIKKIQKHFQVKPKILQDNLASIAVSFDKDYFEVPNVIFSLVFVLARNRVNISEIVSTYTELIFIVAEKDFAKTVGLLSELAE